MRQQTMKRKRRLARLRRALEQGDEVQVRAELGEWIAEWAEDCLERLDQLDRYLARVPRKPRGTPAPPAPGARR